MDEQYSFERIEILLANNVREGHRLEYKAAKAIEDSKEITRDVSSFANASGGVIIYGLIEIADPKDGAIPDKIDPIPLKGYKLESLEQVINTIEPHIPNFIIDPIKISDGNFIYVVRIPAGETAHQALDLKYYRRYNFQRLAMHDQEIRDVMNRSKNPKIIVRFFIKEGTIHAVAYNEGSVLAKHVKIRIEIPSSILRDAARGHDVMKYETRDAGVIHSTDDLNIKQFVLKGEVQKDLYWNLPQNAYLQRTISWKVWADNSTNEDKIAIKEIEIRDLHSYAP